MRFIQSVLIGASYISLFRTKATDILSSTKSTCSMAECTNPEQSYSPGSSTVAFVTTPDEASAKKIAHGLISQKLAACVNIVPKITSIYTWEGKVNEDSESLLMIKTRTSRVEELTKYVRENHPYSVAEVITLPIESGNLPYMQWISKAVPDKI